MPTRPLLTIVLLILGWFPAVAAEPADKVLNVAVVTTVWHHNSHADVIAGRLVQGYTLDGKGEFPKMKLVSLYVDQQHEQDKSRPFSEQYGFKIYDTIAEALTLGGDKLAVDGVLVVAEHGKYEKNKSGGTMYPKRRFLTEVFQVFEKSDRIVPVFSDKHVADNWKDIEWIYGEAQRLKVPMMAGSSLPTLWRYPPEDVNPGEGLKEIVATSYHTLDAYGFHALEMVQCLAERRRGGESGIKQVRCLDGDAVWEAGRAGLFDKRLLDEAIGRFKERPLAAGKDIQDVARKINLMHVEYTDGFKASVISENSGIFAEWAVAWRREDDTTRSTTFWTQEARPFMHFTYLVKGVDQMMHTGQPTWPIERTVVTSAVLDAAHISQKRGGQIVETPYLAAFKYPTPEWTFQQPPEPPMGRPIQEQ
ncbi:MAG TPA: hypothetical protein VMP01_06255 [Pirellulaceae bacterium]|nr:hypothetical protein [Pirellulaceae bacterium]